MRIRTLRGDRRAIRRRAVYETAALGTQGASDTSSSNVSVTRDCLRSISCSLHEVAARARPAGSRGPPDPTVPAFCRWRRRASPYATPASAARRGVRPATHAAYRQQRSSRVPAVSRRSRRSRQWPVRFPPGRCHAASAPVLGQRYGDDQIPRDVIRFDSIRQGRGTDVQQSPASRCGVVLAVCFMRSISWHSCAVAAGESGQLR